MEGVLPKELNEAFDIPPRYKCLLVIAVGYGTEEEINNERTPRMNFDDQITFNAWGKN